MGTVQGTEAAYFLSVNRNKKSLAVDLTNPQGVEAVKRLAATADIVVEPKGPLMHDEPHGKVRP